MFFNLALISLVTNFTILGALVYSVVQWDGSLRAYPAYATWVIPETASLLMTFGLAALVLVPVALFGFMIIARPLAFRLGILYLMLNSLLLLPVRDSVLVSLIVAAAVLALPWLKSFMLAGRDLPKTTSGRFIGLLLYVPLVIMVVRAVMLYALDSFMLLSLSALAFFGWHYLARSLAERIEVTKGFIKLAELLALVSSFGMAAALADILAGMRFPDTDLQIFVLVFAAVNYGYLLYQPQQILKIFLLLLTGMVLVTGFGFHLMVFGGMLTAVFCVLSGLTVITAGWYWKSAMTAWPGVIGVLTGLFYMVSESIGFMLEHGWISLAVIGALTIVAASLLERYGVFLKLKLQSWRKVAG